jgi:calmodulin
MENIPSKEKMKEAFEKKDETGDGRLTFSEMKEIIQLFSSEDEKKDPTFDQMCDMICNMADVNGDKMIDFGEILLLMFGDSLEPENAMKGAFRAYDTNGDGYLDKKELAEVLKLSGAGDDPKFVRMTMAMNDDDDDGKLNYEEFCAMMGE